MKNKRKDIWKILYNLLNRPEQNLKDVIAFVNDILCKDPSLIKPYSLSEQSNRFQDTFVLWIIGKFVNYLGDNKYKDIFDHNLALQGQILRSCLLNRPCLFAKLVEAYTSAIFELAEGHLAKGGIGNLELNSFSIGSMDDCPLLEIDPNLNVQPIFIPARNANESVRALLHILQYSLSIGYEPYSHLFDASLESVCTALKEFDWNTKKMCLRYCLAVFQQVQEVDEFIEHFLWVTFRSLVLIWEILPKLAKSPNSLKKEMQEFSQICTKLLDTLERVNRQILNDLRLFQCAYDFLKGIIEKQQHGNVPAVCLKLVDYMLNMQLNNEYTMLDQQSVQHVLQLASKYPYCLRLLATTNLMSYCSSTQTFQQVLQQKLNNNLSSPNIGNDEIPLELLEEVLLLVRFIEHQNCRQKQLDFLRQQTKVDFVKVLLENVDLQNGIVFQHEDPAELNKAVEIFVKNARQIKQTKNLLLALRNTKLLLETATIRTCLTTKSQKMLIDLLQFPLEAFRKPGQPDNINENHERLNAALHLLTSIDGCCLEENNQVFEHLKDTIAKIIPCLIGKTSNRNVVEQLQKTFCQNMSALVFSDLLSKQDMVRLLSHIPLTIARPAYCSMEFGDTTYAFKHSPYDTKALKVICEKCDEQAQIHRQNVDILMEYLEEHSVMILVKPRPQPRHAMVSPLVVPEQKHLICLLLLTNSEYSFAVQHLNVFSLCSNDILDALLSGNTNELQLQSMQCALRAFTKTDDEFISQVAKFLLAETLQSLQDAAAEGIARQKKILSLIKCCVPQAETEQWLFHFFKMTFFFLVHPNSRVKYEAVLCALEMCHGKGVRPVQLWNWYKRDALCLVGKLAIYAYLKMGARFIRSLKHLTKMLGFSCVQEFIYKYYRLLTTLVLPHCVQQYRCRGLLNGIAKVTRKTISQLFVSSFLRIYTHICLTEEPQVGNKCLELVVKSTEFTVDKLMNTDVKQTISELLIYFNRNPVFVMRSLHYLIIQNASNEEFSSDVAASTSKETASNAVKRKEVAKFIADRFLGIITYFEACLAEPNFEKPLKEEALCSLGQVIRCVGPNHVTQFRFKIIAMLNFVQSLEDKCLQNLCLKVWSIFLSIVNIQELGQSLSCIIASLQQLLPTKTNEVNSIFEYLILKNASILGAHISDLYFIENIENVLPTIRQCVARQTEHLKGEKTPLIIKMKFLFDQMNNENLQVRIYGLQHMRQFIAQHRRTINDMILNEIGLDPTVEKMLNSLVAGCRHDDRNLQLASAKCLGELGAIDPSFMPSKYSYEQISLGVHTDDFAVMALTNLCSAYQLQQDTKYVDNFSLAIQETLTVCGVSPHTKKKRNIWDGMPVRMRQIMTPFLSSCYTSSRRKTTYTEHPIFSSMFHHQYEEWAFAWVSRLIDCIQTEDTRHLLSSYKPSMRRDNNILALFFPYVVLHALQEGNAEQVKQIYEEFVAVFRVSSTGSEATEGQAAAEERNDAKEFVSRDQLLHFNYNSQSSGSGSISKTNQVDYNSKENISRTCTKLCSEQVDFLMCWTRKWKRLNLSKGSSDDTDARYQSVRGFLNQLDKLMISKANFFSGEYTRALLYLEDYLESMQPSQQPQQLQEQISYLIEIYVNLADNDSVESAVRAKKSNLTLSEEILVHGIADRPQEALVCYEQLMSSHTEPLKQEHVKDMIDCYLRMDAPETALLVTDGLWQKLTDQYTDDFFKECKSELFWQLGRYDELEQLLDDTTIRQKTSNWSVQCANSFLQFRQTSCDIQAFESHLDAVRLTILSNMRTCSAAVDQNTYFHSYDEALKLHLLIEVEKAKVLVHNVIRFAGETPLDGDNTTIDEQVAQVRSFFADWEARLCILKPLIRVLEPVFCFRRNLLLETNRMLSHSAKTTSPFIKQITDMINIEIGKLWINGVQMNLECGNLQQAHLSLMKAEQYGPKTLFLEKTKLLWQKGDQSGAFKLLDDNLQLLNRSCQQDVQTLNATDSVIYGEAKLLQAIYHAEAMNICTELNLRYFKEAILCNRNSEKCHIELAQYMEKIYESPPAQKTKSQGDGNNQQLVLEIMVNYAKSLKYGFENVYQSLPRLLSFWLDTTSQQCAKSGEEANTSGGGRYQECTKKMNELINNCGTMLPASIFYTAYSQLLSRICHPSMEVFNVLRTLIIKLVEHFPQQSLWMLLPVLKSSQSNRIKRCVLILHDQRLKKPVFTKLLANFNTLAELLIELTNKDIPANGEVNQLSALVPQLPRLFQSLDFAKILLPFEKYMQATFPISSSSALSLKQKATTSMSNAKERSASVPTNPFPHDQIFLCSISEEVIVIRSAAKPKKIKIKCSDGKFYEVLVKPKDDLRKDFRFMEFNGLVKRYLHQDPEARHRRLRIRTYAAIPFNEECGLVEWIPRLNTFRSVCSTIYRSSGFGLNDRVIRQCLLPKTDPIEKKRQVFLETLLPRHPPVFHQWLRQRFPSPQCWYEARNACVRTIAVMSMVGYILGLGDRHGENILFDETNGDAVHVDFNCLFNQGELFGYPEVVPFRLTHNMTAAMGPLGVEGTYRKSCEITLRLLKRECRTLMSVLRPFVYDLVELSRYQSKTYTAGELTDPKAVQNVRRIEERLKGFVQRNSHNSMPLSIDGQVSFLIAEATNTDNLASMYIGWMAYI